MSPREREPSRSLPGSSCQGGLRLVQPHICGGFRGAEGSRPVLLCRGRRLDLPYLRPTAWRPTGSLFDPARSPHQLEQAHGAGRSELHRPQAKTTSNWSSTSKRKLGSRSVPTGRQDRGQRIMDAEVSASMTRPKKHSCHPRRFWGSDGYRRTERTERDIQPRRIDRATPPRPRAATHCRARRER